MWNPARIYLKRKINVQKEIKQEIFIGEMIFNQKQIFTTQR